ncbi:hypothetical protein [Aeromicrobium sp.]|uniref:hypothetical protein n=1 Tax=Aeromicrobium sp. TaxID=1871063 RepID=UPI003515F789
MALMFLLVRRSMPDYRAQRDRLGSSREVGRFRKAWVKGVVPADIDRDAWRREVDVWPPPDFVERRRRRLALIGVVFLVLVGVRTVLFSVDFADLRFAAATSAAVVVLTALFVLVPLLFFDGRASHARRTARLRAALESGATEGPDRPEPIR